MMTANTLHVVIKMPTLGDHVTVETVAVRLVKDVVKERRCNKGKLLVDQIERVETCGLTVVFNVETAKIKGRFSFIPKVGACQSTPSKYIQPHDRY